MTLKSILDCKIIEPTLTPSRHNKVPIFLILFFTLLLDQFFNCQLTIMHLRAALWNAQFKHFYIPRLYRVFIVFQPFLFLLFYGLHSFSTFTSLLFRFVWVGLAIWCIGCTVVNAMTLLFQVVRWRQWWMGGFEFESHGPWQCDKMASLFVQHLAIFNN